MNKPVPVDVEVPPNHPIHDPAWGEEVAKARYALAILTNNMLAELPEADCAEAWAALVEHQKHLSASG